MRYILTILKMHFVIAIKFQPDSVIMNWVTWLEVSCDIKQSFVNFDSVVTADAVLEMFRYILKKNYFKTLTNSLCIFLPVSVVHFKFFVTFKI